MTAGVAAPSRPAGGPGTPPGMPTSAEFHFTQTESFVSLLRELGSTLLISTYQANKLLVARSAGGGLSILVRTFDRPMGMAADPKRIALGTRDQVWQFRNAPDLAPRLDPPGTHDACFIPRSSHVTGDIGIHEMAWAGANADELWMVNTRFSCLCTLDAEYSFVPRWRPPFITALAAEDRCHLNGLAIVGGKPAYATALGRIDVKDGWRAGKASGGCVMTVPDGRVVIDGLCMPHSPRFYQDRLWVLESGTGRLLSVNLASGERQSIATLSGFARGLAFSGPYAFIGLSKIRPTSAMDGVPLAAKRNELKCGVAVVDIRNGEIVATLDFQSAVEEVFDVQVLAGQRFPEVLGFQKDTIQHTFVVPPKLGA
jgi:uncharacterized protein (TIGR03032 family)